MFRCVAREKSPMASDDCIPPVSDLPLGEIQAPIRVLHLPQEHVRGFLQRRSTGAACRKEQDMSASLPPVVAGYLAAVNAFDVDAIVAAFAPDAYVNDARREIRGVDAIRRWVEKEMVGDHVTMEPLEVAGH